VGDGPERGGHETSDSVHHGSLGSGAASCHRPLSHMATVSQEAMELAPNSQIAPFAEHGSPCAGGSAGHGGRMTGGGLGSAHCPEAHSKEQQSAAAAPSAPPALQAVLSADAEASLTGANRRLTSTQLAVAQGITKREDAIRLASTVRTRATPIELNEIAARRLCGFKATSTTTFDFSASPDRAVDKSGSSVQLLEPSTTSSDYELQRVLIVIKKTVRLVLERPFRLVGKIATDPLES